MRLKSTLIALSLLVGASCTQRPATPTTLKDAMAIARPDVEIGVFRSIVRDATPEEIAAVHDFEKAECNVMTIGVYMFFRSNAEESEYLKRFDEQVEFARANNIKIHLHPLIGPDQYMPKWLTEGDYSVEELEVIMRDYITLILTRYPDIASVDVVNEALNGLDENGDFIWNMEDNIWLKMGWYEGKNHRFPRFLIEAFKIATEVAPESVKLIYNENKNSTVDSRYGLATLKLYHALREEGLRVDAIGLQVHMILNNENGVLGESWELDYDYDNLRAYLALCEEQGVDFYVSEFDMEMPENPTEEEFEEQGRYYGEILSILLESPRFKSFKTWGTADKFSWIRPWRGFNCQPLLLDMNFEKKPAYYQMLEAINNHNK